MDHARALELMKAPKWGDPPSEWRQHKSHRSCALLEFGVTDQAGASIVGQHVTFEVMRLPRVDLQAVKLTLFQMTSAGAVERVYQIDNPGKRGRRPGEHDFPHAHIGEARVKPDNPAWTSISFNAMLDIFLAECNLTIASPIPDFDAFHLR